MTPFLASLTTFACLMGMAASLCLGLYVISRRAIRGLARALHEMEQEARPRLGGRAA